MRINLKFENKIFKLIFSIFSRVELSILSFLARINIGKRLFIFILFLIISIIALISYNSVSSFTDYALENENNILENKLEMINGLLLDKKNQVLGFSKMATQIQSVRDIVINDFDSAVLIDLNREIKSSSIELRDKDFRLVNNVGSQTVLDSNEKLSNAVKGLTDNGVSAAFFSLKDLRLDLNAVSTIKDEYGFESGSIVISNTLDNKFMKEMASNTGAILQLYVGNKLSFTSSNSYNLNDTFLLENVKQEDNEVEDNYFLKQVIVKKKKFLVGFLAIKNLFNQEIGYITVISPLDNFIITTNNFLFSTLFSSLIFIVISLLVVLLITRSITVPLKSIISGTNRVASGDLTRLLENHTKDQLSVLTNDFNEMIIYLRELVNKLIGNSKKIMFMSQNLSANSQEISAASEEVAATSEQMASSTRKQAKKTEITSVTIKDIERKAKDVSDGSNDVMNAVIEANDKVSTGLKVMGVVNQKMNGIKREVNQTESQFYLLEKHIQKINDIIDAINYLNEETTLLSFNAKIEAARAGEAGRGFAIIAGEIKKLADKSTGSVKEINLIFRQINESMKNVNTYMTESSSMVNDGEDAVNSARVSLDKINDAIDKVKNVTHRINENAKKQLTDTKGVDKLLEEVNEIAKFNADGVEQVANVFNDQTLVLEEMAQSSDELSNVADVLGELISNFKIEENLIN